MPPLANSTSLQTLLLAMLATALAAVLVAPLPAAGLEPTLALTADSLDWEHCRAFAGGVDLGAAPRAALAAQLGLEAEDKPRAAWSTGPQAAEWRHFRLAFREPPAVGTLVLGLGATQVAELKPEAPYPGDPEDDTQWTPLAAGAVVVVWPPGHRLRALRITDQNSPVAWAPSARPSQLPELLLLRERFASALTLGGEEWQTSDQGREWQGHWVRPLPVAALAVFGTPCPTELRLLPGDYQQHPLLAPPESWRTVSAPTGAADPRLAWLGDLPASLALAFRQPGAPNRDLPRVVPLFPLADDETTPGLWPPAPVTVDYEMPLDGFVAVHLADDQGRHVRRLVAEVERSQGLVREGWDLRDDFGRPLPPGTYHWKLLARPPLKLTYEGTVYNAGHPPWRAPVPGGGWWMADHSPPSAIANVGDYMVMAALGAEFGTPLIVTDLDGRKVWHDGDFGSHSGASRLVSDGQAAYAVNDGDIYRIVPGPTPRRERIHTFAYTDDLPGHAPGYIAGERSGAAARPGLLCVAYNAPEPPWIVSTIRAADLAPERNFPPVVPRKVHDTALTPAEEVSSAFQLGVGSRAAFFGDALASGPQARTLLLALRREVPLGSVLLPPADIQVYALRPGQKLPPDFDFRKPKPQDGLGEDLLGTTGGGDDLLTDLGDFDLRFPEEVWMRLSRTKGSRPQVAVPTTGLTTTALVFTGPNLRRLPYAMALDRRYCDIAPQARLVALEGEPTAAGGWRTSRAGKTPISAGSPAVAALVWDQPTPARGYLLLGPMAWAGLTIEVWDGPADAVIDREAVADDQHWRTVQTHRQTRGHVKYNWHTPMTLRGDLGGNPAIRALRVRVVEHPVAPASPPLPGEGGFEALVVFQHLAEHDPELPETLAQRLTVLDLPALDGQKPEAKVRIHLALDQPGALAFAANGDLYAACKHGIVRLANLETQTNPPRYDVVVPRDAYRRPLALSVDDAGLLYLLDGAQRQILVFDPASGQEQRRIGKPGGQLGPFDPETFTAPSAMALDTRGKLWVVEQHFQPKRISRWSRDGQFEKDFMGPTHYGGGGLMDPGDRSVINHLGMKFRFNWDDRTWKLESRLAPYDGNFISPDRVLYAHGRRYLTAPAGRWLSFGYGGPTLALCEEIDGVAVPLAAAGILEEWQDYRRDRDLQQAFGQLKAATTAFVWTDANRDRLVQLAEVQVVEGVEMRNGVHLGDDLSLNFASGYRLRATGVRDNGVPIYDLAGLETLPAIASRDVMVDADGRTFVMGHTLLDRDGKRQWHYPDSYASVQRSMQTPWGFYNRPAGVLCGSIHLLGHFRIGDEHLFCVGGNNGDYYAFTDDGFLAAAILGGPNGYGRRFFSMADCRPGHTDLSDLRKTVEDFHGQVTRAEDGKVYAIAGKNHISVIRVDGLEAMQRRQGTLVVGEADVAASERWVAEKTAIDRRRQRPRLATAGYAKRPIPTDGDTVTAWPDTDTLTLYERHNEQGNLLEQVTAKLAFDADHLYLAARATDDSPMLNSAAEPALLFQHGDALDLQLGLDPQADDNRLDAAPGDVRLLFAELDGKPVAVLLRYHADGTPTIGQPRTYSSPMGSLTVADVGLLANARLLIRREGSGWLLEAAIPWRALGIDTLPANCRLRGDLGILWSDPEGRATVARHYWANRSNVVLGDLPAETRVQPALWGTLVFDTPDLADQLLDSLLDDSPPANPLQPGW